MDSSTIFRDMTRINVLEALLEDWSARLTRDGARQRLSLLNSPPETRAAALVWFDMRWPEVTP